jgi:hypothetical protein
MSAVVMAVYRSLSLGTAKPVQPSSSKRPPPRSPHPMPNSSRAILLSVGCEDACDTGTSEQSYQHERHHRLNLPATARDFARPADDQKDAAPRHREHEGVIRQHGMLPDQRLDRAHDVFLSRRDAFSTNGPTPAATARSVRCQAASAALRGWSSPGSRAICPLASSFPIDAPRTRKEQPVGGAPSKTNARILPSRLKRTAGLTARSCRNFGRRPWENTLSVGDFQQSTSSRTNRESTTSSGSDERPAGAVPNCCAAERSVL